jgi:hypothetical protein
MACIACPFPARTCTSAAVFQSCIDTFYATPINGFDVTCTPCPTANNVVNCFNATYATSCQPKFYAVNGTCVACPNFASSCIGRNIISCLIGFFINRVANVKYIL